MFEEILHYFDEKGVEITPQIEQFVNTGLERKLYKKGEIIVRPGEACNHTFFVAKGLLRAYTIDEIGKEHILQFAPENWLISDRSSVLFNEVSEQFIEAIEDSEVILIESGFFEMLSEMSASFQRFNIKALNNHIRYLHKRINLLISATAEIRYLDFVKLYPDIMLRVPQLMVASYLGITPESLSRVRKELARKNFKPS